MLLHGNIMINSFVERRVREAVNHQTVDSHQGTVLNQKVQPKTWGSAFFIYIKTNNYKLCLLLNPPLFFPLSLVLSVESLVKCVEFVNKI